MSDEPVRLRIACAEDLFTALESPQTAIKGAVLQAIATNIPKALEYQKNHDKTLVSVLLHMQEHEDETLQAAIVATLLELSRYQHVPELEERLLSIFATTTQGQMCLLCADTLARNDAFLPRLLPHLRGHGTHGQQAAVATALTGKATLNLHDHLLVALHSSLDHPVPPLDESTLGIWKEVLQGPSGLGAVSLLSALSPEQQETGWKVLASCLDDLPLPVCTAVMRWAVAAFAHQAIPPLIQLLTAPATPEPVLEAVLQVVAEHKNIQEQCKQAVHSLLRISSPSLRIAALAAGGTVDSPDRWLEETNPDVLVAVLSKLDTDQTRQFAPAVARHLTHSAWEVRAGAVQALALLGPPALDLLKDMDCLQTQNMGVLAATERLREMVQEQTK